MYGVVWRGSRVSTDSGVCERVSADALTRVYREPLDDGITHSPHGVL